MNIVHIAPNAPYNEGWGYQENLLTKYQAKLGHTVTLIVTDKMHADGRLVKAPCNDFVSASGYRVIRRPQVKPWNTKFGSLFIQIDVYGLLLGLKPDFVFYHGFVSATIFQVTKYKRKENPNLVIVQDNHLDHNIGYDPKKSLKAALICGTYRLFCKLNDKYISKYYGVTPWRKRYAEDVFGAPKRKTDVLIMGADDEKVDLKNRSGIRNRIRGKFGISDDDFLIVTGGKIDKNKKTDILLEACAGLNRVKLLVFGKIVDGSEGYFGSIIKNSGNIIFIGWLDADKVYEYFFAADLAFFPGQHSVLWEQACASKVPCVFERWDGMEHVNHGGNSGFVSPVTVESIREKISELQYTDKYYEMKRAAESEKTDIFLYSRIAEKSLECAWGEGR